MYLPFSLGPLVPKMARFSSISASSQQTQRWLLGGQHGSWVRGAGTGPEVPSLCAIAHSTQQKQILPNSASPGAAVNRSHRPGHWEAPPDGNGAPGSARGQRPGREVPGGRWLSVCPSRGGGNRKENCALLVELDFVPPSGLADFRHLHCHGNQQRDGSPGMWAPASFEWKGTRWSVMKHILVRK